MNFFKKIFTKKKLKQSEITNPLTVKVPICYGNRYVISDIHGCLKTFKALITKLNLSNKDQVFLLGDYIDRGADSKGVVDYVIELQEKFQIYPLRGNHEEDLLLLIEFKNNKLIEKYVKNETHQTLFNSEYAIEDKYITFINKLPYFIELENTLLVHAGFDYNSKNPYTETEEMLWIRDFEYNSKFAKNKTIIHGHTPYSFKEISTKINNNENIIPLDNGCVFKEEVGFGNLLCLNINTFKLIIQKNIEK